MCQISSIRLMVMIFSWFKIVFCLYIFVAGIILSSTEDFLRGFGIVFVEYGVGLVFLALLSLAVIVPHKFGVNRHNRFLLLVAFVFDTIVFAELIDIGLKINSFTVIEFDKALQIDCLRNAPVLFSEEECRPFYESDRTAGFRLFWQRYASDKDGDKVAFQVLTSIEGGDCCGFFAPFRCDPIEKSFPNQFSTTDIDDIFLTQIVECGPADNYYVPQEDCTDFTSIEPPIVGGCRYDSGAGNRLSNLLSLLCQSPHLLLFFLSVQVSVWRKT